MVDYSSFVKQVMDQDNEKHYDYLVAYPPVPNRVMVKQEPKTSGEKDVERISGEQVIHRFKVL